MRKFDSYVVGFLQTFAIIKIHIGMKLNLPKHFRKCRLSEVTTLVHAIAPPILLGFCKRLHSIKANLGELRSLPPYRITLLTSREMIQLT